MAFAKYPPINISEAITVFKQDVELAHGIVHGDEYTEVLTENGLVPSFKNVIEFLKDEVASATGVDVSLRDDLADTNSNVLVGGVQADEVALSAKNGIASSFQLGFNPAYLGFLPVEDIEYQNTADSTDKLVNGNMSVGKQLYGVRRNATVLSARANASDGFEPQITGVTGSQELADYGSADQCAVFADITTTPFNSWEIVAEPVYTTDGFTATGLDASKIKIGMIAKTDHLAPYWGIITSVSPTGCTVDKWSKAGVPLDILPASGFYGLKINPIFKLWAINANVVLTPDGRADVGAICEFGLINQKIPNPTQTNGVDMIVLGSSTYDGTAAFLSRGGGSSKWQYGLYDQGSKTAALLAEGSARGLAAQGVTTGYVYAKSGAGSTDRVLSVKSGGDYATSPEVASIDGLGRVQKLPRSLRILSDGVAVSNEFSYYVYGDAGTINVPLPSGGVWIDGDSVKVKIVGAGTVVFSGGIVSAGGLVGSLSVTGPKDLELVHIGGNWFI